MLAELEEQQLDIASTEDETDIRRRLVTLYLEKLNDLDRAEEHLSELSKAVGDLEVLQKLAQLQRRQGHIDEAKSSCQQLLESSDLSDEVHVAVLHELAEIAVFEGDYEKAIEYLEDSLSIDQRTTTVLKIVDAAEHLDDWQKLDDALDLASSFFEGSEQANVLIRLAQLRTEHQGAETARCL